MFDQKVVYVLHRKGYEPEDVGGKEVVLLVVAVTIMEAAMVTLTCSPSSKHVYIVVEKLEASVRWAPLDVCRFGVLNTSSAACEREKGG